MLATSKSGTLLLRRVLALVGFSGWRFQPDSGLPAWIDRLVSVISRKWQDNNQKVNVEHYYVRVNGLRS